MINLLKDEIKKEVSGISKIPEANITFTTLSKFASSVLLYNFARWGDYPLTVPVTRYSALIRFHNTLNAALTEVIAISLHREPINSNCNRSFFFSIPHGVFRVTIISSLVRYTVCYKVFSCPITLYNDFYQFFRNILIICK